MTLELFGQYASPLTCTDKVEFVKFIKPPEQEEAENGNTRNVSQYAFMNTPQSTQEQCKSLKPTELSLKISCKGNGTGAES